MVARLDRPLRSPCLEFAYAPHRNGRVAHFLGFATSEPFIEDAEGGAHPRNGIAMRLGRSATNTNNSTVGLAEFVDGGTHWLSNTALPFQLVPGHPYACRLLIEGPSMTATVSDGRTTGQVTDQPSRPLAGVGQVFVADFKEGVSAEAPPGRYRLRFDDVKVTDRMYRITIDVRPGTGPHLTASTRTVSVAMLSTPTLDAAELDQSSIRLDGIGVGRGPSSQGYACRAEDADGGGTLDLVCEFEVSKLALRPGRRQFTIEACTGGAGQSWEHRVAWVRGRVAVVVDP
jgi:hypothetical protein